MIKAFTAAAARALMPEENKFEELVADAHKRIAEAAKAGLYEVSVSFSIGRYKYSDFNKVKDFLKKEGYEVLNPMMPFYFIINWKEQK